MLLAAVIAAAVAPGVDARTRSFSLGDRLPAAGPVLSGSRTLWAEARHGGYVLRLGERGRRTVRAERNPEGRNPSTRIVVHLAASPSSALVQRDLIPLRPFPDDPPGRDLGTLGGAAGGPFRSITSGGTAVVAFHHAVDLSGTKAVYPTQSTSFGAEIRDLASSAAPVPVGPFGATHFRIAGRFVAWEYQNRIVVYDYEARREAYAVIDPSPTSDAVRPTSIDLQPDGKLAVVYASSDGQPSMRVAWASPSAPTLHLLSIRAREQYAVRIAGDRIAYVGGAVLGTSVTRGVLGLSDLAGHARAMAKPVWNGPEHGSFDFDGERVAWTARSCNTARIYTATPGARTHRARARCKLRLKSRVLRVRRGRARLRTRCVGFYPSCRLHRLRLRTARSYRIDGHPLRRGTSLLRTRHGTGRSPRVRLNPTGRRLLKRYGALRTVVGARVTDDYGTVTASAAVTLQTP
jgi:hypothetical protein